MRLKVTGAILSVLLLGGLLAGCGQQNQQTDMAGKKGEREFATVRRVAPHYLKGDKGIRRITFNQDRNQINLTTQSATHLNWIKHRCVKIVGKSRDINLKVSILLLTRNPHHDHIVF